jgi:ribosomal protein S6--L-glutamate ligase
MYNSRDKLRASQLLSSNDISIPKTMMLRKPSKKELEKIDPINRRTLMKAKTEAALEMLGGAPVIIKLPRGTQGVGVMLCKSMNDVHAQVETFWKQGQDFMVQEFIKESSGMDIRAMVVGNTVVASMRRVNKSGDFRSNTHQGGEVFPHTLTQAEKDMAIKAAHCLELNVAGVDMLMSKDGLKIVEVNSTPGFQGLELATGINVAEHIMKYAKSLGLKYKKKYMKKPVLESRVVYDVWPEKTKDGIDLAIPV